MRHAVNVKKLRTFSNIEKILNFYSFHLFFEYRFVARMKSDHALSLRSYALSGYLSVRVFMIALAFSTLAGSLMTRAMASAT